MIAATLCAHRKCNDDDDVDSDGGELGAAAVVDDDDADGDGGELGAAAVVSWCVCCKGCLYTSPDIVLYTMHQTSSWRRSCAIMRVFRIQMATKTAAATTATSGNNRCIIRNASTCRPSLFLSSSAWFLLRWGSRKRFLCL